MRTALAIMLSCIMAVGMLPAEALADERFVAENVVWEGEGDDKKFVQATFGPYTLTNRDDWLNGDKELSIDNLGKVADKLSVDWAPIAGSIFGTYSPVTIDSSGDNMEWDWWYGPGRENGDSAHGGGCEVDVTAALAGKRKKNKRDISDTGGDRYNRNGQWRGNTFPADGSDQATYMTSGLQYATSLDEVLREMCDMSATAYVGNSTNETIETINHRKDKADLLYKRSGEDGEGLSWMKDDANGQTPTQAMYRIVSSQADNDGHEYSNNYALIFYDFQLTALTGDDLGDTVGKYEVDYSAGEDNTTKTTDYIENRSQEKQEEDLTVSSSTTETVSSSFTDTETIAHAINAGVEYGFEYDGVSHFKQSMKLHFQYTWTETNSTAYTKGQQLSNSSSTSSMSRVNIPAHTVLAYDKTSGTNEQTLTFDCPAVLNYKVAIVSLCWIPREANDVKTFSARFGSGVSTGGTHATQNLYKRAMDSTTRNRIERSYGQTLGEYKNIRVNGISWDDVEAKFPVLNVGEHIQNAATQLPMFTGGMKISAITTNTSTIIDNIQPLYQLAEVRLTAGNNRYAMAVGDKLSLDGLAVDGYNAYGIDYYGFQPSKGEWVLCNEEGNEIDSSDVIDLDGDAVSGSKQVVAKSAGKAYLKWVIANGTTYKAKEGAEVSRSTKSLQTPIILVTVSEPPADLTGYAIEAEGEGETFAGKELNLANAFNAVVVDASDKVVSYGVTYEARDETKASIDNNVFTATKPGDYKVRATYTVGGQTIRSDWLTVHVYSLTKHDAVPATCTEDGSSEYWECDQDGKLYADEDGTLEITAKETVESALGHDLEHVDATEATCTKGGNIEHYLCKRCGKLFADDQAAIELGEGDVIFTDALGHDWDEGVVDPGPGCVTTGTKTYTCRREGCGITKAEEVAALGHDWNDWIEQRPATDTEDGEEKRMCIYCSAEETRTIPAVNHVHDLSKVDAVAPTCTTDGNVDYWLCSRCDNIYADDAAQTQINKGDEVVSATGHAWDEGTVTTDPTCTGTGIRTLKCTNQGCDETKDVEEPAHGHDMQNVIESVLTEPTCTTTGLKKLACAYSESEGCTYYKTESIAALDHAWDEGKVTTEPTCTAKGTRTFTCTHKGCGQTRTEGIAAIGHEWDGGKVTTEPTCTDKGTRTFTCTHEGCGQTRTEDIAAIGHEWGAWTKRDAKQHQRTCAHDAKHVQRANHVWDGGVVTKEATVKYGGTVTYTCADCGATKTKSTPKLKIAGTMLNSMVPKGKTSMAISWTRIAGVDGYDVYLAPCNGKGRTYELEIVESDDAFAACNTVIRDLKKNTCYKARVRAFVNVDGEKVYVKNGMVIHCHTSGGSKKYTYPKAVKVNKTKLTLKKGKSTQIKAYAVKKDKSKRLLRDPHVATLRYKSSNTKVATVSKSGRILAKGKGTCKVYVIAPNGVRKAVTVKVK